MNKFEILLQRYNGGNFRGARAKLARDLDVTEATVGRWASLLSLPSKDKLERMALLFGVTVEEVRKSLNMPAKQTEIQQKPMLEVYPLTQQNTINLPILADVPAGLPEWSDRDVEYFFDIPRWLFPKADFVIRCIGDSLAPRIQKGDFCVVRKEDKPIDGKTMLVKTEDGFTMKKIHKLPDGAIELCSTNENYKPFVPKELSIIGLIIGHWSRDDKF